MNPIQRFHDWRREVRIKALRARAMKAHDAGQVQLSRRLFLALFAECDARSPQQVRRMERAIYRRMSPQDRALFDRYSK
jgi:hypothetical protein